MFTTVGEAKATTTLRKRVETVTEQARSVSFVDDGTRSATVVVRVNVELLVRLYGRRALLNKKGKATGMNGAVEIVTVRGTVRDDRNT